MNSFKPSRGAFLEGMRSGCTIVLMVLITISTKRMSEEKKVECAQVLRRVFEVVFTYYRLSTAFLFRILSFLYHKLKIFITRVQKFKLNDYSKCIEDSSSRWSSDLPEDIMQNVLQRLCLSEFFICGAVCASWKAMVDRANATPSCRPTRELPWLLIGSHPFSTKDNGFLCLTDDQKFLCSLPDPTYSMKRGDCVGSIDGWLIMADSVLWRPERFMKPWSFYLYNHQSNSFPVNFFFLNPFTGARVMLPSSKSNFPCNCETGPGFFLDVRASSIPTNQDCFVVSVCARGHLAFCRPTEKSWTLIDLVEAKGLHFYTVEIINEKIYAATSAASMFIMVFDAQYINGNPSFTAERLDLLEPRPIPNMFRNVRRKYGVLHKSNVDIPFLAKDSLSEDLFMIFCKASFAMEENPFPWDVMFGFNYLVPPQIQGFRVFKMEWKIDGPQWVEIFDLGDRIIFMTLSDVKVVSISNYLDYKGNYDQAFQRNCIYFAFDSACLAFPSEGKSYGVFSMASRSIKRITLPTYHSLQLHSRPVWFTPNPW